ncbi:hypothetical protein Hanom_Chr14g01315001 [Helianthus anomalus]
MGEFVKIVIVLYYYYYLLRVDHPHDLYSPWAFLHLHAPLQTHHRLWISTTAFRRAIPEQHCYTD